MDTEYNDLDFSHVIKTDWEKHYQIRVTISTFRDVQYLHVRKYFLSFEEEWLPTKEGISIPLEIHSTLNFFTAFMEIISNAEFDSLGTETTHELRRIYKTILETTSTALLSVGDIRDPG